MEPQCHAEHTDFGVIIDGIAGRHKAEKMRDLFARQGLPGIVAPFTSQGDYRVFLIGATLEDCRSAAGKAGIELCL